MNNLGIGKKKKKNPCEAGRDRVVVVYENGLCSVGMTDSIEPDHRINRPS